MLSNIQFRKLLNKILRLPVCEATGATIKSIQKLAQPGRFYADVQFGPNAKNTWRITAANDKMIMVDMNTGFRVPVKYNTETLELDPQCVELIKKVLVPLQYKISDVVATIANAAASFDKERSETYSKVYLPISQCVDDSGKLNLSVVINGQDKVPLKDIANSPILSSPITAVNHLTLDIYGYLPQIKRDVPYFHLIIDDGQLAVSRYMFVGGKIQRSNVVDRIDINSAVSADKFDAEHPSLHDQLTKAVENWHIGQYDADSNGNVPKRTLKDVARAAFGYVSSLKRNKKNVIYCPANDPINVPDGFIAGYGIDDFYDCYPNTNMDISVYVARSSIRNVCITYASKLMGNIARIYVDVDLNSLENPKDLNDHKNIFLVASPLSKAAVAYNSGAGKLETVDGLNIVSAICLVRELIALAAFMGDIALLVKHNTSDIMRSERNIMDEANAMVTQTFAASPSPSVPASGKIKITSRTNNIKIVIDCAVVRSSDGFVIDYKILSGDTSKNAWHVFDKNGLSVLEQGERYDDGDTTVNLGMLLTKNIRQLFATNVMHDARGRVLPSSANQQQKVYNATRFQSYDDLGGALLDVRDAIVNTFGPGIIGTPDDPSKFNSKMNTSDYNSNVTVKNGKDENGEDVYKPTAASFSLFGTRGIFGGGGAFTAMYDEKGVPHVRCSFSNDWKEVTLDGDRLSEDFLRWFLLDCPNQVTITLRRAIENGDIEKTDVDGNIIYKIDPQVVEILKSGYEGGESSETPFDRVPKKNLKGSGAGKMYIPKFNVDETYDEEDPEKTLREYDAKQKLYDNDDDDEDDEEDSFDYDKMGELFF